MHADRIYVLEKGKIIESGRHEELLGTKGLYYAMWRQQIGERMRTGDDISVAETIKIKD
jgi:ATP-binding cassette subfamily B protein